MTGTDTIAVLEVAQAFSAAQKYDIYIDLKAIAEPSSPASGSIL